MIVKNLLLAIGDACLGHYWLDVWFCSPAGPPMGSGLECYHSFCAGSSSMANPINRRKWLRAGRSLTEQGKRILRRFQEFQRYRSTSVVKFSKVAGPFLLRFWSSTVVLLVVISS